MAGGGGNVLAASARLVAGARVAERVARVEWSLLTPRNAERSVAQRTAVHRELQQVRPEPTLHELACVCLS